jgi:uncharacterized membrane protein YfcA
MSDPLLYVAAGLLVGVMIGLTGVGGGSLMTPILVLLFGQSPSVAVGTDLVFAATTKLAATASFGHSRRVDWRIVGRLALGSIPGAAAVLVWFWLTRRAPGGVDQVIEHWLAAMLVITAFGLLLQNLLKRLGLRVTAASLERAERWKPALTVATGLVLGVAVTLTSVGAGALGTVALLYLYPLRLTADRLVATDIAHALPVTILAGIGHASLGHVNLPVLGCLLLGSIPGVLIASRTAIRLPQAITRTLIAIMLAVVGGRMLLAG